MLKSAFNQVFCAKTANQGLFSKIKNNRFCGVVASALMRWQFFGNAEKGGTKAQRVYYGGNCAFQATHCTLFRTARSGGMR